MIPLFEWTKTVHAFDRAATVIRFILARRPNKSVRKAGKKIEIVILPIQHIVLDDCRYTDLLHSFCIPRVGVWHTFCQTLNRRGMKHTPKA
jgi:hypothetical protein